MGAARPSGAARAGADEALELVGRDPRTALTSADAAVLAARREGDGVAVAVAHRAAGLALRELNDLGAAQRRARAAVAAAVRAGAEQVAAQARMSLALVLLDQGRTRAALAAADRAALALRGLPAAQLKCQKALILQRTGRLEEALATFAEALPVLRRAGDALWEARALNNRGLLYGYRGALVAAESDLARARALHLGLGLDKFAADVDWNRGFVAARRGDAPAALALFDAAESALVRHGAVHPQLYLDRAEVLLTVGLAGEARRILDRTIDELRTASHGADLAEGLVLLARAALADGDPEQARSASRQALTQFVRQRRTGWAAQAGVLELRAAEVADDPPAALLRSALASAAESASVGWRAAELDARLVAAAAATRLGRAAVAREQLRLAASARGAASLDVRVRAWYATALLRVADGRRAGALAAVRAALAGVDRQQAALGATEFRVHVAGHGGQLARLGLDLAVAVADPRLVLGWAERLRARSLRLPPARPPADAALAEALAESRRLSAELLRHQLAGRTGGGLAQRQRAAEERVVQASRTARSPLYAPAAPPPTAPELVSTLDDAVLVEYLVHQGELLAVTVRAGRCRLHRLGPVAPVGGLVEAAHFGLRRLTLGLGTVRSTRLVRDATVTAGRRLAEVLLAPLSAELSDSPAVVVPTGALHAVPWGLLPELATRPVRVAPSAGVWLRASRSAGFDPAGTGVFAAGPGLPAARDEVLTVAGTYPGATVLTDDRATAEAVLDALDGVGLAHLAAHGRLRTDNPLFSALVLDDGPLTVYDLERVTDPPRLVVLPACQSGVSAVRAGDELMGLAAALLALGTRTVVAAVMPVHDAATTGLMAALHDRLRRGEPPPAALARARADIDATDTAAWASAAAFSCFGG
ncbi:CHAT domain-containing protein [Plantactinospora mayteni]|uniref:CHAT domain-containing protein n=1 Tax=Plantactinospora mayteni TaxID=566021 RepID=UPI0031EDC790